MQAKTMLVVSDPPHGDVKPEAAAAALGAPVEEVRLKLAFAAPEILAASDADRAEDVAESLAAAGVSAAVRDGEALASVPWPVLVSSFEFGPEALLARCGEETLEIDYGTSAVAVYCKPPDGFVRPSVTWSGDEDAPAGLAVAEALEWMAHLDLCVMLGGELRRISMAQDLTDFSGLGAEAQPGAAHAMMFAVAECRRRFAHLRFDDRLESVRPRRRFVAGAGFDLDQRRRYAFGTLLLRHVLESISGDLRNVTQYELGSRLAYVLARPSGAG